MVATLLVPSILVRRITTIGFGTRNRLFHLVCSIPKGCNSVSSQLLRNKLTPFSNHNNRFSVATSLREAQKSEPQQNAADLNNLVPSQSESVVHHLELAKKKNIAIQREEKKELVAKNKKTIKQNLATIYRIIKLGKPDLKLFIYAIAFILIAVLYPTTAVKLVGASIDAYNSKFMDADGDLIIWGYKYSTVFAVMVPFMCFSAVCFWARIWVLKLLGERLVARLRLRVMKNLLRHDAAFYDSDKHKVGDLISRLSSDAYVVSKSITSNLPDGLKNLLFGIISAYMMYSINPILFGVMLLISPPITIGSVRYGEKIRELSTRLQNATAGLTKVSEETLNSIKLVKAFTGEPKELTKYAEQLRQVVKVAKKEAFAQSNYLVSIYTLYHTGYLSCIALGVYLILQGQMTTGDVVAFTMYLELFNLALYSLTTTYMELMKGSGAGVKLFDLIDHDNQVEPVKGEFVPPDLNNEIEFDNVVFSYPTRKHDLIFDGCTFKVPASSSTCFVAPSGCGKSTIAVLLLRSYNIQSGSIKIGGKDISEFQVRELRRSVIGIVQQEPILLSGSILENIVYGLTPSQIRMLTMDDIVEVCKQANCHDFIAAFPEGYDTIVGGRGASLSGGQKQRVAIARALIKKPKILILDEATSALDSKSEALINDTLRRLTAEGKMTIISIAHRLSTISKSENVIVFGKGGHVVESGKFQDLYSDASSELSKLLDESSAKKEYAKLSDEEIEEQDKLDYEAATIEAEQRETELEQVRALIDDLSPDLRKQLLEQISREADMEQGVPNTGYIKGQHKSL